MPRFTTGAVAYWGNGALPSCGAPTFRWVGPAAIGDEGQSVAPAADAGYLVPCQVRLNTRIWQRRNHYVKCLIVFHELGHLYGHDHGEGGVMSPNLEAIPRFAPCETLVHRPRPWSWRWLRARWSR